MNYVNIKDNKIFCFYSENFLRLILSLIIYIIILHNGLAKGGRWDLNEQIINGFNIFNGNFSIYSPGINSGYGVSTVYPYLQPLLLGFLSKFIPLRIVEYFSILFIAPCLGLLKFNLLTELIFKIQSNKINFNFPKSIFLLISAAAFYLSDFYLKYLSELKPDTFALIFIILSIFFISKKSSDDSEGINFADFHFKRIILVSICLFLSCSLKQQFLLPSLLITFYITLKTNSVNNFLILISGPFLAFFIPNIFLSNYLDMIVFSHMGRGFGGFYTTTYAILITLISFVASIFFLTILSNIKLSSNYFCTKYKVTCYPIKIKDYNFSLLDFKKVNFFKTINGYLFLVFGAIFFSQLLSSYNTGGNVGNFQMGFLPLFILVFPYLIEIKNFSNNQNSTNDYAIKNTILISLISLILILVSFLKTYLPLNSESIYFNRETKLLPIFEKLYDKNAEIIVDGNTTILAFEAGYKRQISLSHIKHLDLGKLKFLNDDFLEYLESKGGEFPFIIKRSIVNQIPNSISKLNKLTVKNQKCYEQIYCTGIIKLEK